VFFTKKIVSSVKSLFSKTYDISKEEIERKIEELIQNPEYRDLSREELEKI